MSVDLEMLQNRARNLHTINDDHNTIDNSIRPIFITFSIPSTNNQTETKTSTTREITYEQETIQMDQDEDSDSESCCLRVANCFKLCWF